MLIKVGERWVDASSVTGLSWDYCGTMNGRESYALYICRDGKDCVCGKYDTKKGAAKAMDEAAEKINAAQGCKIAAEGKVVMKYEEHGDEPNIIGVYRCSRCKTVIRKEHSWYKFCPCCGREIERWE